MSNVPLVSELSHFLLPWFNLDSTLTENTSIIAPCLHAKTGLIPLLYEGRNYGAGKPVCVYVGACTHVRVHVCMRVYACMKDRVGG